MDSSWDWVEPGEILCPSLFYAIGLCTYADKVVVPEEKIENEEDSEETGQALDEEEGDDLPVGDKVINF